MKACGDVYAGARAAVRAAVEARVAGGRRRAGQTAQGHRAGTAAVLAAVAPSAAQESPLLHYHVLQMSSRKLPLL